MVARTAPHPSRLAGAPSRLESLDTLRGLAIGGMLLSHAGWVMSEHWSALGGALRAASMFASPMFILTSAVMLATVIGPGSGRLNVPRRWLADRAFFTLSVGHVLVALAHAHTSADISHWMATLFTTDTIAASVLVALVLVPRLGRSQRLLLALFLYTVSWYAAVRWHPLAAEVMALKVALVGDVHAGAMSPTIFSFTPWLGVFLAGTVVGESLADSRSADRLPEFVTRLAIAGAVALVLAVIGKAAFLILRPQAWAAESLMPEFWLDVFVLTSPFEKYPPGPTYLLAFGGVTALLAAGVLWIEHQGWFAAARSAVAALGRASFAVFLVEFSFYYALLPILRHADTFWLVLWGLATIALVAFVTWGWNHVGGNRWLTVGLKGTPPLPIPPLVTSSDRARQHG